MELVLILLLMIIVIIISIKYYKLSKKGYEILTLNTSIATENKNLEENNARLSQDYDSLVYKIEALTTEVYEKADREVTERMKLREAALETSFTAKEESLNRELADRKQNLILEYNLYKEQLEKEYDEILKDLSLVSLSSVEKVKEISSELDELKAKQNAYIQEKLRQEQITQQASFYKMDISAASANDIKILRENVQPVIAYKDLIDKLIWEGYYKVEYDKLAARLFGDKTDKKVCGIYKITCLTSDKAYIGQSVDIKTRFKEHIKAGLAHTPSSNKLYSEMQQFSPENFTFELLEEVPRNKLDDREAYWIDFYRTKDYGLNTQKGNGGK